MSGDVTPQALERLTKMPDGDDNYGVIAAQKYYDVYFTGGTISGVTISGDGNFDDLSWTGNVSGITNGKTWAVSMTNGADLLSWQVSGAGFQVSQGLSSFVLSGGNFTISSATLALGANSLTMTGSIGATGARVTKGWFTDIESTNAPTIGGTAATGSGGLVRATSPSLVTPILGTPTSGTLTNCTGFPAANLSGLGTGVATFLATPSSANLASAVTDETGSGALMFGTDPALTVSTPTTTSVGYLGAPQNSQSSDYGFVLTDSGKHIYHPDADVSGRTWTIPANVSIPFPIGTVIVIQNGNGAGVITLAITSDTLRWGASTGSRSIAANGTATLLKVTSTVWRLTGDGIS